VQNGRSTSGCLWICFLIFFPLWPVTIPIAIIVWLSNRSNTSVTSLYGPGQATNAPVSQERPTLVVMVCVVAIILLVAFLYAHMGTK
jgi:uncharacterized membrane protein